jgi:hypothetical protein
MQVFKGCNIVLHSGSLFELHQFSQCCSVLIFPKFIFYNINEFILAA